MIELFLHLGLTLKKNKQTKNNKDHFLRNLTL